MAGKDSHRSPFGSTSPFTPHSPSTLASLVRLALAQSIDRVISTIAEVAGVRAVGLGSILDDSM